MISARCVKPIWRAAAATSSATACRYALVCSGWPLKISGLPVMPVGQFGMWQRLAHDAADRHHQRLAEAELVGPEQGVLDDVVAVLDAAADAELHRRSAGR